MSGTGPKLKLLCLHGYMQNAEVFRSRLGSMRKALKSRVELIFVDAPFEAQGLPGDDPEELRTGRSWWQWTDTGPAGRPSKATTYTGWPETQAFLLDALREHQPDGLLGFSQGATATALLLTHLAEQEATPAEAASSSSATSLPLPKLKCAILVAGFLPRDPAVAALVEGNQDAASGARLNRVPLLFVSGTSDALVPPERTAQLYDCFDPATVSSYTHSGAHLVPTCSGDFKSTLSAFLDAAAGGGPVAPLHRVQSQGAGLAATAAANGAAAESRGLSASQSGASLASGEDDKAAASGPGEGQKAAEDEGSDQGEPRAAPAVVAVVAA